MRRRWPRQDARRHLEPAAIDADWFYRDRAIVEQIITELKACPLAHLPSGKFTANAAWLQFACLAHSLARAAATAAGLGRARIATLLRKIIATPSSTRHHE